MSNSKFPNKSGFYLSESDSDPENTKPSVEKPKSNYIISQHQKEFIEKQLPAAPLIEGQYSLEPDMLFGYQGPIPLTFTNNSLDNLIGNYCSSNPTKGQLIYLGFQPQNTFVMHDSFSGPKTYNYKQLALFRSRYNNILQYLNENEFVHFDNKKGKRQFFGMKNGFEKQKKNSMENPLEFDSYFESGNLDCVFQLDNYKYHLYMRVDANTKGHNQWFYFKISNICEQQTVKFTICNFTKNSSLYQRGMRPYVYSRRMNEIYGKTWYQPQLKDIYYGKFIPEYEFYMEYSKKNYCLSFEIELKYPNDEVYFAYCIPYTYSYLLENIKIWINSQKNENFEEKLCQTLSGVDVPMITVTDYKNNKEENYLPIEKRKLIIVTARVHPGESNGSWMMHVKIIFNSKGIFELYIQ